VNVGSVVRSSTSLDALPATSWSPADDVRADAILAPVSEFAWHGWSCEWDATQGEQELACRATDAVGDIQPLDASWNHQAMGNNVVQRLRVTVRSDLVQGENL
jgi:molybdenum-dependent oxidoreductase-like protein